MLKHKSIIEVAVCLNRARTVIMGVGKSVSFSLSTYQENSNIWSCILVECISKSEIDLINVKNGNTEIHAYPENTGHYTKFHFVIDTNKQIMICKVANHIEAKIKNFLQKKLIDFRKNNNTILQYDNIYIEAIPKESEPITFFKKNPNLATIELKLAATAMDTQYGLFGGLFADLNETEKEFLTIKIEVNTTKRSSTLPTITISNFASFLENIKESDIIGNNVREVVDGRRHKAMKLLNAITEKNIEIEEEIEENDNDIFGYLCEFTDQIDVGENDG